ncbi:MAG: MASE1 domain-containing protein [Nitrospinaceae bacterium]
MTIHHQGLKIIALAGMYFVTAWGVSILGFPNNFSLPIYPAAGVALGGCICCGIRLWPGVFLGALAFNAWFMNYVAPASDLPFFTMMLTSSGMALAAVAQVLVGTFLFNRFISSLNPLNRAKDVLIFIFLVAAVGCAVSAPVSLGILSWGGHLPWEKFIQEGFTWWLGDVMGVLLVTPLFFVFRQPLSFRWTLARRLEAGILLFLFYITSQVVFGEWLQYSHYPLVYLLAPCLVWAAYRFGHPGTVIVILMVSSTAVWGTMAGRGPFTLGSLEESFALLQSYLLVLTIMTLILSAAATEAENAQTQSARFGRVLDESSNEIYLFDAETLKFIQVNRGAQENLGYSLEELKSLTPLDLKPGFTRKDLEAILKPLRHGTDDLVTIQARHQRKDGTLYPVEVRLQLSHAEVWPVFVAIVQDITEKKKTEEELSLHRHHLEELVMQRTADLESTHLQLLHAEKLSATGKMAASMAHEFNNPIYGIRNVLEKIMRRVKMEGNNKRFIQLAIQECDRVAMLIRKVLDFHSPSTDEKEWIDVHESIDDMILMIQKRFSVRDIHLTKEYAADMPNIEAVPDQFKQVVLNILQNAEEAIPGGGGRVTITTSAGNGMAQIQIKDTGTGISPQVMKNIFDPFFTTKPSVKGTGLGLSVAFGIIKKHRGEIRVDSQPGRGATFTICLPVKRETPATLPG